MTYIVMTAAAHMPSSCKGRYRRIAIVEISAEDARNGFRPTMISERARGIRRIVESWERLNVGGPRSAYALALAEAEAKAATLNNREAAR